MMGYQSKLQPKLFYYNVNLERRVPQNHILRKINEKIDFTFIYKEVRCLWHKWQCLCGLYGYLKDDAPSDPLQCSI